MSVTNALPTSVSAPTSTTRIYYFPDGSTETYSGGTLAWRNNNPGNLRYGPLAIENGAIGEDGNGFAIFPDEQIGMQALNSVVTQTYANDTIYSMMQSYAPSSDNNNTSSYINYLVNAVGVPSDTPISSLTSAQLSSLEQAIKSYEGTSPGTTTITGANSDTLINFINENMPVTYGECTFSSLLSLYLGNAQHQVIDPLVLSMNGQPVTTTSLANGAFVDYQNTGFAEQSSWFSANAGILVDVTNPNGTLNNGFTIIGSSTTNQNGNTQGQAGFTQLAALDTNHDGVINASDTDFNQIEIWVGSNGQPGSGHLETLAQAGITSISLNTTAVNTTDANGDKTLATSTITYSNSTTGTLSDMNMSVNTSNTIDESAGVTNSAYASLPDVAGWGDVHNLQTAMALDTTGNLANLVQQYIAATPAQQATLINNLIFTWTGVVNDPQETTYHFTGDTREIDALSKFVGAQYSNDSGWSDMLAAVNDSVVACYKVAA